MGKEVFRVLRKKHGVGFDSFISEKVTPFFGDVSLENLGIKDSDLEKKMHKEINIVANFAAATTFQERYDVALAVNTMGPKHVLNFTEKCENLEMILHASTAFVCIRETPGVKLETYLNQIFKESSKFLDVIEEEKKLVQQRLDELKVARVSKKQETAAMIELGLERAKLYGWPNTYVFMKALGEMTIGRQLERNFPVVIVRPTAVTSTYREPFPGWIEGFKSLDPVVISIGRGKLPCFIGDHDQSFIDIIPGDMVVNAIVVAMVNHLKTNINHNFSRGDKDIIYHIGSSTHTEPLLNLLEYAYDYFRQNPLMGGGMDEIVKPVFFPTMSSFQEHIHNNYVVPMKEQKVQFAKRWAEIYERYVLLKVTFDTSATDQLRMWMKAHCGPEEAVILDFDPKQINWKEYMMNSHIPGLMKYVVKSHAGYNSKL
ncbi:probable fatty acyl-CoA reductase 5 isoform X2 [Papaver somniferum]|nr:probable fatty acyl-CoA reductase 5 isoform X2 [Papaver somniferum]